MDVFKNRNYCILISVREIYAPSDRTDKIAIDPICALSRRTGLSDVGLGTMYAPQIFSRIRSLVSACSCTIR